jgi:hypothetical protein
MIASQKKNDAVNALFLANSLQTTLVLAALFAALSVSALFAQTGRANITGVVMDSQGAMVAGATVTVTNQATGVATAATTNGAGAYSIIQIIPGAYDIRVEKQGFTSQIQQGFTLVAEQNAGLNYTLQLGRVSERVSVEAGAELIQTETAELGQTINEESINELPLNGRNPASLVFLTPGAVDVSQTNASFFQGYTTFPTETGASVNGGRQGSTFYLLDGVYNMDNYQLTAAPFPNPDAVQEFSVIGNNFDPRFGFATSGVVSIVTKSGTNSWHGDVFEFLRNGSLNAADYFTGQTDEIHRNQFGGSLGGPIIKDKLFVFGNFQGTIIHSFTSSSSVYVPSDAMRAGDFSALCLSGFTAGICNDRDSSGNVANQIWHPSIDADHSLANAAANAFPNNFVDPATYFNPGTSALAALLPHTTDRLGHLTASGWPSINDFHEETGRVDYNLNDHNRLSGRAFLNFFDQPAFSATLLSSDRSWKVNWQNYGANWTWTVNPHIVNTLNGAYTRMYDSSDSGLKVDGKNVCFSQFSNISDTTPYAPCSIEDLEMSGGPGPGFGIGQNYNAINRWTWGVSDSLSISKGKHLLVMGIDTMRQYWNLNTNWLALPLMQFDGGPNGNFTGYGFSDFLMGQESFFMQGGGESDALHAWLIQPYVADQYKVTPHLTVSAGLRWEPYLAPVPVGGRIPVYWPGHQSTRYPNSPVDLVYPGDAGVPDAGLPSSYKNFNPKVGIAWQPKALPNTSIRAAFGIYSTPLAYNDWNPVSDIAPFSPTISFSAGSVINGQQVPIIPFSDPWSVYTPTNGVSPFPPFSSPGNVPGPDATFPPAPNDVYYNFDRHFTAGQNQTWNLSLEHQFGSNWMARAAYVGAEAYHLPHRLNLNPGQFFCGPVGPNCTQAQFDMNGTKVNPRFNTMQLNFSDATSSYNSGQFTLERRMAHGLQFTANYTYSHTIDVAGSNTKGLHNPLCLICNRGNSDLNFPQIFVANFIYQTPKLAGWNAPVRAILGGWEMSGIYRAQSGIPITILSGLGRSYVGGTDHADYASSSRTVHVNSGSLDHYLVASDFAEPGYGSQGNTGRNIVSAPGTNQWDLGFNKNIRFGERYRLQFRWEMFNAFNHPSFGQPDNNLNSGTFGQITYSQLPPRTQQAALKLYF